MIMDLNSQYGNGYYGAAAGQPMPGYYNYQPYMYQQAAAPQNMNALTNEEIKILRSNRPTSKINLNIDQNEYLQALCTHKDTEHHTDVVYQMNDGSGRVFCPICNEVWNPDKMTKEEITDLVEQFISQIQNMKWVGDMPVEVVREYCAIIPLVRKFPELYEYAVNNFNKYAGANQYYNAGEAAIYSQYNSLMNGGFNMNYAMPQGQPGYYGQQPFMNQPIAPMGQPANPSVNPMQANVNQQAGYYGQPQPMGYPAQQPNGYYGAPAMGGYPAQPQGQPMGFPGQPVAQQQVAQPMPSAPQAYSPVFNPAVQQQVAAPAQNAATGEKTETKEEKVNL